MIEPHRPRSPNLIDRLGRVFAFAPMTALHEGGEFPSQHKQARLRIWQATRFIRLVSAI